MNTKQLKAKILDLAIHGKLVPQNPDDEPASKLLERIREEKAKLIAEKKVKADKNDSYIFVGDDKRHYEQMADGTVKDIEDEIPFELPEGWAWCRLTNVAITELGKTLDAQKNKGELYDYLCALNVKWYTFDFTTLKQIRLEDKEKERYLVRKGDLLICEGGDVGRAAIWESENPIYYQNALHRVRFYQNINQYFFLHLLNYYKNLGLIDDVSGGVTIKHFTQNSMQKLLFPLAPLNEQGKIVEEIDRIFSLIDSLDKDKEELQTAIKQTKSKILDLAIHGKIVEQNSSDEPASVLLEKLRAEKEAKIKAGELKRDKNDSYIYKSSTDNCHYQRFTDGTEFDITNEIPFELPENWAWCRLGNAVYDIADIDHKMPKIIENGIPFISPMDFTQDGKIDFEHAKKISKSDFERLSQKVKPSVNDIIFPRYGTIGVLRFIDIELNFLVSYSCATIVTDKTNSVPKYVYYALQTSLTRSEIDKYKVTTTQSNIGIKALKQFMFPLPPLAEQKRIVEKIENAFAKLDFIAEQLA